MNSNNNNNTNSTNSTGSPTLSPTMSPTFSPSGSPEGETDTLSPSVSPTGSPEEDTDTFSPTGSPTNSSDIEIIKLPSYKDKDPVDGIFIVVVVILLLAALGACIQSVKKRKRMAKRDQIRADMEAEFSLNEEDGENEIELKRSEYATARS